ncbi:hypothetical protein HDU85_005232 [Gaertneriomyces sp. JEL0708]|nr:hypothetical protein HDU85_005232 [Gaertneriomyces sp. JEL0708]
MTDTSARLPSSQPTPYTLPGVLQFLQVEWRKFERDRNDWEVERSDLTARVAFLEGERRAWESLRMDLVRRCKMLEYALKQERMKINKLQQQTGSPTTAQPPDTNGTTTTTQPSTGSTENIASAGPTLPENVLSAPSAYNTVSRGGMGTLLNFSKGYGQLRSKEILKNYLREIDLLRTGSASAPHTASGSLTNLHSASSSDEAQSPDADRPQRSIQQTLDHYQRKKPIARRETGKVDRGRRKEEEEAPSPGASQGDGSEHVEKVDAAEPSEKENMEGRDIRNPTKRKLPKKEEPKKEENKGEGKEKNAVVNGLTESEMEELKLTPEKVNKVMSRLEGRFSSAKQRKTSGEEKKPGIPSVVTNAIGLDGDALASLTLSEEDVDEGTKKKSHAKTSQQQQQQRMWRPKVVLRNHMDAIRSLTFHPTEMAVVTASEDCTAKLWKFGKMEDSKNVFNDAVPIYTFRGHTAPLTSSVISPSGDTVFTASADATIRVWKMPDLATTHTYSPYASTVNDIKLHTYVGHSDVVWDMKLHPLQEQHPLLASVSSDGAVKIWKTAFGEWGLKSTFWYNGAQKESVEDGFRLLNGGEGHDSVGPTSVDWVQGTGKIVVSWQNSALKLLDVETGAVVLKFDSQETFDGTTATQINKVVAHPTLPLIVTAHEDKYVRLFDLNTGKSVHSMIAHQEGVAALDIDSAGLNIVTGGHDCSLRWWDLTTRKCLQEHTTHRKKNDEGVWSVAYHKGVSGVMGSAGADGLAKVYWYINGY